MNPHVFVFALLQYCKGLQGSAQRVQPVSSIQLWFFSRSSTPPSTSKSKTTNTTTTTNHNPEVLGSDPPGANVDVVAVVVLLFVVVGGVFIVAVVVTVNFVAGCLLLLLLLFPVAVVACCRCICGCVVAPGGAGASTATLVLGQAGGLAGDWYIIIVWMFFFWRLPGRQLHSNIIATCRQFANATNDTKLIEKMHEHRALSPQPARSLKFLFALWKCVL